MKKYLRTRILVYDYYITQTQFAPHYSTRKYRNLCSPIAKDKHPYVCCLHL